MAKWLSRIVVVVMIFALVVATTGYYFTARSIPNYDLDAPLENPSYQLAITRDAYGVPHIDGETDRDAYFALGFAHAQDRLWQMVQARRTVQGRLSQIYGEETLPLDRFMRSLDLWHAAQRSIDSIPRDKRARLDAYADGVNAYIAEINRQKLGSGAPEFLLYSRQIVPWTAIDSVALLKMHALQSTAAAEYEIEAGTVLALLGPDGARQFGQSTRLLSPAFGTPRVTHLSPTGYGRAAPEGFGVTADVSRTADKAPLLGIASSTGLTAPSQWYLAHMAWGADNNRRDVIGATVPGIPVVFNGHNQDLAWGMLPSTVDDQDLVILRDDGVATSNKIEGEEVAIALTGARQVKFTRRSSVYGPIIPIEAGAPWTLAPLVPKDAMAALAWPGLSDKDSSISAMMALMDAKSVSQARRVMGDMTAPTANLIVADRAGQTANYLVGARPERSAANLTKGATPTPSWIFPAGFVATTNEPLEINNVDNGLAIETHEPIDGIDAQIGGDRYTALRARDLMANRPFHTVSSFAEAQNDVIAADARSILALIAGEFLYQPDQPPRRSEVLGLLGNWRGEFDELDPEPLIYTAWVSALDALIFSDEFGASYDHFSQIDSYRLERVLRNENGMGQWCDIKPTPEIEDCIQLADIALDRALDNLTQAYGSNVENWRWGRVHLAQNVGPAFADHAFLTSFVSISHQYSGGGETLLNAPSRDSARLDFNVDTASSFRMIVDFSDIDRSQYILSTGQSGHLLSPHYDDQSVLWRDGEYLTMSTDKTQIGANTQGTIEIGAR